MFSFLSGSPTVMAVMIRSGELWPLVTPALRTTTATTSQTHFAKRTCQYQNITTPVSACTSLSRLFQVCWSVPISRKRLKSSLQNPDIKHFLHLKRLCTSFRTDANTYFLYFHVQILKLAWLKDAPLWPRQIGIPFSVVTRSGHYFNFYSFF